MLFFFNALYINRVVLFCCLILLVSFQVEVPTVQNPVKPESDFTGEIRVKSFAEIMEEKRLRAKRNEESGGKVDNCKSQLSDSKSTYTAPKGKEG